MFSLPAFADPLYHRHCTLYIQGILDASEPKWEKRNKFFVRVWAGGYDLGRTDDRSLENFPSGDDWYTFPEKFLFGSYPSNAWGTEDNPDAGVHIELYRKYTLNLDWKTPDEYAKKHGAVELGGFTIEGFQEKAKPLGHESNYEKTYKLSPTRISKRTMQTKLKVLLKCGQEAVVPCRYTRNVMPDFDSENKPDTTISVRNLELEKKRSLRDSFPKHQYLELVGRDGDNGNRCVTTMGFNGKSNVNLPDFMVIRENDRISMGLEDADFFSSDVDKDIEESSPRQSKMSLTSKEIPKFEKVHSRIYRISIWNTNGDAEDNLFQGKLRIYSHNIPVHPAKEVSACLKNRLNAILTKLTPTEEMNFFEVKSQHIYTFDDPHTIHGLYKFHKLLNESFDRAMGKSAHEREDKVLKMNCITWARRMYYEDLIDECHLP